MTPVSYSESTNDNSGAGWQGVNDSSGIAERFLDARRTAAGLDAYPGDLPETLDQAYAIQDQAIANWGRPVLGWKVGRVLPPLTQRFHTDRLAGPIFNKVDEASATAMPVFAEGFAAGEAEFLLRVGTAPAPNKVAFTLDEAAALIDAVHIGIEVASSPLGAINDIGPVAVISDFGNNNGLVVGAEIPNWRTSGFEQWTITTLIDGTVAGTGQAVDFPDGAIGAARFLFELMAQRGITLTPGQWISTGAVTGVHPVRPGQEVVARFNDGLSVACRLTAAEPE